MSNITGLEWYNTNSLRKYPIADDVDCRDVTGSWELPTAFIVDCVLAIDAESYSRSDNFYFGSIAIFGYGITVTLMYDNSGTAIPVASFTIPASHVENTAYTVKGTGDFENATLRIVIGNVAGMLQDNGGAYAFERDNTKLVATCVRPDIRGVRSIQVVNGQDSSPKLTGAIRLVSGTNVRLRLADTEEDEPKTIIIDAIDGAGMNVACDCDDVDRQLPDPIRSINGVSPDSSGNITLVPVGDCMEITTLVNGLNIKDTCSTPCCDSADLKKLVEDLLDMQIDVRSQRVIMQVLEAKLDEMTNLQAALRASGAVIGE